MLFLRGMVRSGSLLTSTFLLIVPCKTYAGLLRSVNRADVFGLNTALVERSLSYVTFNLHRRSTF